VEPVAAPAPGYPASFAVDHPERITNWKPLVQWLLALPHYFVLYALQVVSEVVSIIAWFAIVFTGKLPEGLAGPQHLYVRYGNRVFAYFGFLREEYPPFAFGLTADDAGDVPAVRTDFETTYEDRNRLTVAFRWILALPQFVVVAVLGLVSYLAILVGAVIVLFTGKWPEGLRDFVVNVARWVTRVNAYVLLLTDEYPPFRFE
jgi:hypothetical protein